MMIMAADPHVPKTLEQMAQEALAEASQGQGIPCPKCGCRHRWEVYGTKGRGAGNLRYRRCRNCGEKCLTIERLLDREE